MDDESKKNSVSLPQLLFLNFSFKAFSTLGGTKSEISALYCATSFTTLELIKSSSYLSSYTSSLHYYLISYSLMLNVIRTQNH